MLEEPPMLLPARPGGAAPTAIAAPTRATAASREVPVRPTTEVAAAGAAELVAAKATTLPRAVTMVVERLTPEGSAVAVAASASKVFLLRLLMSTHASVLVDSVGPPSAEVCRAAASFP
jgi:hypothetical protein